MQCWVGGVRVDFFALFPILGRKPYDINCRFFVDAPYQVKDIPFYFSLLRVFIIITIITNLPQIITNGCWILSKAFPASIEMIIWFLFFNLLMWCITLIDLHIVKTPCIPGINSTWSWGLILLMCCCILFAGILLRIFASIFISDIGL